MSRVHSTAASHGEAPSRQVILQKGVARVVLGVLDVPGVDRLWKLAATGVPVRVDAGLEWEHRTVTVDPAIRSVWLPAGGTGVVLHDSRFAKAADLAAAMGGGQPTVAVVYVSDRGVEVLGTAAARVRADGSDEDQPRQRLTRALLTTAAMLVAEGVDLRTVRCGPALWHLLAVEAPDGEQVAFCYDDPLVIRGRYPFVRDAALDDDAVRYMGPSTFSGTRFIPMWLPISRAQAVGAATDVIQDMETVFGYVQRRADGSGPEQAAAASGAVDGVWKRRRAAQLGIAVEDPAELAAFVVIGLTVAVWRNTALEELHSGWADDTSYPEATIDRGSDSLRTEAIAAGVEAGAGIPDDVMLRLNTWTQHQLACYATPETVDLAAVQTLLCDPGRVLQIGDAQVNADAFFGARFAELTASIAQACDRLRAYARRESDQALWYALAISGRVYASDWWGSPYWPDVVDRIPADLLGLPARRLLVDTPWLLTSGDGSRMVWTRPFEDAKAEARRAWYEARHSAAARIEEALVV